MTNQYTITLSHVRNPHCQIRNLNKRLLSTEPVANRSLNLSAGTEERNGLSKEVIICRFGSAYSTLTVWLIDKRAYDEIQEELNQLEATKKLQKPVLASGERVCFRDYEGKWVRARIRSVHDVEAEENRTVDIVLEITKEIYTRVSAETLLALPPSFQPQKHAFPYFIKGLEPYHVIITHKDETDSVTAQRCADALNEIWDLKSRIALLEDLICPYLARIRAARYTRIFVASLIVQGSRDIPSFIQSFLKDYVIVPLFDPRAYFDAVRHPDVVPREGSSVLVPYVSEREICEVVSLRKHRACSLRVGLRLLRYLDQEQLFERLLGGPARQPGPEPIGALSAVCINFYNSCIQRGVVLRSGKVLGIDNLDVFDPEEEGVELCSVTYSLSDVFPHLGLFIDWDTTTQTPCLGDFVVVTNLRPLRECEELFQYSYDDVKIMNEPAVIGGRDIRVPKQGTPVTTQREQLWKKKQRERSYSRKSVAEWYGLSSDLTPLFSHVYENDACTSSYVELLFSEFAVSVPFNEL